MEKQVQMASAAGHLPSFRYLGVVLAPAQLRYSPHPDIIHPSVWAINDHQALDHIIRFQQAGLRVPQDISVVGTNDTPWASSGALPLTTLSLNPAAIAEAIATAVETTFGGGSEAPGNGRLFIRPVLVPRASTVAVRQAASSE